MRMLWIIPVCSALMLTGCGTGVDIWKAVEKEDLDAIARYAEKGEDLNAGVTFYGKTPLLYALLLGKKQSYQKLLDLGADPNVLCARRQGTVMHRAAVDTDSFWLKQALAKNGDPNLINTNASQAGSGNLLAFAIGAKKLENVRLLLDAGADLNGRVHNELTPFSYACERPALEIALFLLKRGADYQTKAKLYQSAIFKLREKLSIVKSSIAHKQKPSYSESELKALDQIVEFLKADGFDPETAVWDGRELIWKQP